MRRWAPLAAAAVVLAVAVAVPALGTLAPGGSGTVYACVSSNHQFTHVSVASPLACPSQQPVSWPVTGGGSPSPSPSATSPAPSPSPSATSASPSPSPTATGTGAWACTTSDPQGRCGTAWDPSGPAWCGYPGITGVQGGTNGGCPYTDQNEWSPISGETQTLNANGPGDWQIVSNTPAGNTSVTTFPNTGAPFNEQPLASFSSVVQSFTESMPHNAGMSAWNMADDWFDNWKYELMIQSDFSNNGDCAAQATGIMIDGQSWHLCTFGNTAASGGAFAFKLGADEASKASETSGSYDVTAMAGWLVSHGYWSPAPTVTNLSYGFEICSTGGQPETFAVTSYTLSAS